MSYAQNPTTGWVIITEMPHDYVTSLGIHAALPIIVLGLILVVAAGVFAYFLINGIQKRTQDAVVSMQTGTEMTVSSVQSVNEAGSAFQEIVAQLEQLLTRIERSAEAIKETNRGSKRITEAVHAIETVASSLAEETQTVSAATEEQTASVHEVASASKKLEEMAAELQGFVERFKLRS